jgi:ABC-type tungstate transport system substrate-binding protein
MFGEIQGRQIYFPIIHNKISVLPTQVSMGRLLAGLISTETPIGKVNLLVEFVDIPFDTINLSSDQD